MSKTRTLSRLAGTAALAVVGTAFAQGTLRSAAPDSVPVDISAIRPEVGARLDVSTTRLPILVDVPAHVAASACGMADSEPSNPSGNAPACRATELPPELESAILQEVARGSNAGR